MKTKEENIHNRLPENRLNAIESRRVHDLLFEVRRDEEHAAVKSWKEFTKSLSCVIEPYKALIREESSDGSVWRFHSTTNLFSLNFNRTVGWR